MGRLISIVKHAVEDTGHMDDVQLPGKHAISAIKLDILGLDAMPETSGK